MRGSSIRKSVVRFALIGLVCLGVVGGALNASQPAAAMPRTSCEVFTDLSEFWLNQSQIMSNLGYYSLSNTYYQRHIDNQLRAALAC